MYIKKKVLLITCLLFVTVLLTACAGIGESVMGDKTEKVVLDNNLDENSFTDQLIENNWSESNIRQILGDTDSTFLFSDIYFNKGFDVRYLNNKLFNVVFHEKYTEDIIPGINMNTSMDQVITDLGQPQFQEKSLNLIGYKEDNYYIFFVGKDSIKEVSVYRRDADFDKDGLNKVIEEFNNYDDKLNFPIEEVLEKYLGQYDNYLASGCQQEFDYSSRGLIVHYQNPDEEYSGLSFEIYGNYSGYVTKAFLFTNNENIVIDSKEVFFELYLDKDLVFEHEKDRIGQKDSFYYFLDIGLEEKVDSPDGSKTLLNLYVPDTDSYVIGIQYLDRSKADYLLDQNLYEYGQVLSNILWVNERNIMFYGLRGIYIYDILTQNIKFIYNVQLDPYKLKSIQGNELVYMDSEGSQEKILNLPYKISNDGEVILQ